MVRMEIKNPYPADLIAVSEGAGVCQLLYVNISGMDPEKEEITLFNTMRKGP